MAIEFIWFGLKLEYGEISDESISFMQIIIIF